MPKWLKQSTACTIPLGPFVDDTDGKTAETSLTVNQAAVRLRKNGGAAAQVNESTTATHDENGYYLKLLNTTDTGTLGRLQISAHIAGALPVWDDYMVVPAMVYDSLIAGSDRFDVNVTHIADTSQTARDIGAAVPAATAGASGGLQICGSNAATTYASLTVTGAVTVSDGISVSAATTDRSAATFTGNGTGSGIVATGGGSTGSAGINATGTIGITAVGTGATGWGISASGTSSAGGLRTTSTAASGFTISGGIAADSITVSGATTLAALSTSGTTTLNALTVTNATTLTGAVSLGSTLGITGKTTFTGAVALSSTLAVADTVTFTKGLVSDITGTLATVTTLTNLPAITSNWLTAAGLATDAVTEIAGGVWDLATSGHTSSGTFGEAMSAAGASGDPWTTTLPGSYTSGQAGYILGTNLNGTITSRMATYTQPTGFLSATFPGTVASTTNITAGTLTTVTNLTNLPAITSNWLTAAGLASDAVAEIQSGLALASGVALTSAGLASVAAEIARVTRGYANVYYVDPAGNDSNSGLTPTLAKLTLAGAKSAAAAGSLIVVNPGTYNERNLFKTGVDWHFVRGAIVNYTGSTAGGMWDDSSNGANGAVVCRVTGYGRFIHATTGTSQIRAAVLVSNDDSVVHFECLTIENRCTTSTGGTNAVHLVAGTLTVSAEEIVSDKGGGCVADESNTASLVVASRIIDSTASGTSAVAIQCGGFVEITADEIKASTSIAAAFGVEVELATVAGGSTVIINAGRIDGYSGIYTRGSEPTTTIILRCGQVTSHGQNAVELGANCTVVIEGGSYQALGSGADDHALEAYADSIGIITNASFVGGASAKDLSILDNAKVYMAGCHYQASRVTGTVIASSNLPAITTDWLTATGLAASAVTEIQSGLATSSALSTVAGYIDTEVAAIKAVTDQMAFGTANRLNVQVYGIETNAITAASMASDAGVEIATACMALTDGVETGITPKQALRAILAMASGSVTGAGSGTEVFTAPDGSTARLTFTVDVDGNRTTSRNL